MKRLLLITAILVPALVSAEGYYGHKQFQGQGQAQLQGQGQFQKSFNKNRNSAKAGALAGALAGSKSSAISGDSSSISGDSSASATVHGSTIEVGGGNTTYKPKRQSPGAPSITAFPSGQCTGASIGVSGGWLTGAFGLGGTSIDKECSARYNIQMLQAMFDRTGHPAYLELINQLILNMDTVKEALDASVEQAEPQYTTDGFYYEQTDW